MRIETNHKSTPVTNCKVSRSEGNVSIGLICSLMFGRFKILKNGVRACRMIWCDLMYWPFLGPGPGQWSQTYLRWFPIMSVVIDWLLRRLTVEYKYAPLITLVSDQNKRCMSCPLGKHQSWTWQIQSSPRCGHTCITGVLSNFLWNGLRSAVFLRSSHSHESYIYQMPLEAFLGYGLQMKCTLGHERDTL